MAEKKARKNEKLAQEARLACEKFREDFKFNIDQYHEMHGFVLGQQWTAEEEDDMIKTFRKVPMTANKLPALSNSLLGEQQMNTPQLQVVPKTNCSERTAYLREIMVKDGTSSPDATIALQVAAKQAAIGGYGAYYLGTKYAHERSFEQDIYWGYYKDATRAFFDLSSEKPNKTDGMFCGDITRMSRKKFRKIYGKELEEKISKTMSPTANKEEIALAVQPSQGDDPFTWQDNDSITIINYYIREYKNNTLYKLSNGNTCDQEELDALIEKSRKMNAKLIKHRDEIDLSQLIGQPQENETMEDIDETDEENPEIQEQTDHVITLWDNGEPVRIEEKKSFKSSKIMHYEIAGDYILEQSVFPSTDSLPIIFLDQDSYYDKVGKQICVPFFVYCKDTQRYINYIRTQSAFILKVSRYDQFIASKKNLQSLDTQRNWRDPNSVQGALAYDESPSGAKPEQIRAPELPASLLQQYQLAIEDLYLATGLYPARLGQEGNETSGKAVKARSQQGSYATFIFRNSVSRALEAGGICFNEMIPNVYDSERVITLMMPDEGMKNITINKQMDDYGELIENDIRKGTFEVRLKAGPSYEGQKEEALDSLQQVLQADPGSFKLIADLYADNLPLANNLELKNRLKTQVPPEIIEAGKTGKMPNQNNQPSPEQMAMELEQQKIQLDAQFKKQQLELKKQELQVKIQQQQIDLQIEMQKLQAEEIEVAGQIEEQKLRYLAETNRTESDTSIAHANNLVKILTHNTRT